jgi:hypothetical protein
MAKKQDGKFAVNANENTSTGTISFSFLMFPPCCVLASPFVQKTKQANFMHTKYTVKRTTAAAE